MILYEDNYEIHLEPMAEKIKHYFNCDFKVYRGYGTHYPDLIPVWFNNNNYAKYNMSKYLYFRK